MPRPVTVRPIRQVPAKLAVRATPDVEPDEYVLPVLQMRVPERVVDIGFWGALGVAALFGVVDAPLAVLIGAGVLIARHSTRNSKNDDEPSTAQTAVEPD